MLNFLSGLSLVFWLYSGAYYNLFYSRADHQKQIALSGKKKGLFRAPCLTLKPGNNTICSAFLPSSE
ncbi:MAG: hypothetical protein U0U70_11400 [Chitinophagaceae bacterium]